MLKVSPHTPSDDSLQPGSDAAPAPQLPPAKAAQALHQVQPPAGINHQAPITIADDGDDDSDAPVGAAYSALNDSLELVRVASDAGIEPLSHDESVLDVLNTAFYDFHTSSLVGLRCLEVPGYDEVLSWDDSVTHAGQPTFLDDSDSEPGVRLQPWVTNADVHQQDTLNASFFDFVLATPLGSQGSQDFAGPWLGASLVHLDLDGVHHLAQDLPPLPGVTSTHALPRLLAPLTLGGDATSDLLDSEGCMPEFLLGCPQQASAAFHAGSYL